MQTQLLSVWGTIGSVALAVLVLLAMITVHEFGHYCAGKIFKFKIDEFSIGFGPALFKHRSKKSGELFAIRLIPLGGYCAFAGEDGLEEETEPTEEEKEQRQSNAEKEIFAEVFPEEGEQKISEPNAESEREASESNAESEREEAEEQTQKAQKAPSEKDVSGYFTNRPCWQRIIVLVSGALMNYLFALILLIIGMLSYGQTMTAVYEAEPPTDEFVGYSFEDKDIFLEAGGKNLYLTTDIAKAVNGKKRGDLVEFRISRIVGEREDGSAIREEMNVQIMLRSDVNVKNSTDFDGVWKALGVKYQEGAEGEASGYLLANAAYKFGFGESLGRAFVYSFKLAGSIFRVLGELFTGKLGLSAFGGPVTTITLTSQMVSRGFRFFLEIAGYIGVNLAVFNLLPIPALDGSKVVFTVIEWIRKKPLNRKVEAVIHAVGFLLLIGFAVLVDILQFV